MNQSLLIISVLTLMAAASRLHVPSFGAGVTNSIYSTKTIPRASTDFAPQSPRDVALAFAKKQFKLKEGDYVVKRAYQTAHSGVTHVYLRQLLQGTEVVNGDMNINVDKAGNILSYGSSFLPLTQEVLAKSKTWTGGNARFVSPTQALKTLAAHLKQPLDIAAVKEVRPNTEGPRPSFKLNGVSFAKGDVVAEQSYVQNDQGVLVATWRVNVPMEENWFDAQVSADGSKVLSLNDWVADSSYNVFPYNELAQPDKVGRKLITDPEDKVASPNGWFDQGDKKFTNTIGNNVFAQENWKSFGDWANNTRPDGGEGHNFDFPFDLTTVDNKAYVNATVTNLFYMNNVIHDLFYRYGFDEVSGNFQQNNWGKGGKGGDAVVAHAQDGSGTNNANFGTPPDGQPGRMRMYLFTMTTPKRDGDFSNDIIVHEYAHGISNRLTGGPDNVNCLGFGESGGMGEGWGDWLGQVLQLKETDTAAKDMVEGSWVLGESGVKTIRKYKYSTSTVTNPTNYTLVNTGAWSQVHAIGEIWCNTLYEMYWSLADAMGRKYNANFYSADKESYNTLALQIVIDGMKLQPCNPTFVSARDAILQAEKVATGGKYQCAIWKAFAKRGVGANAKSGRPVVGDFNVPDACKSEVTTPGEPTEPPKPEEPKPEEPKPEEPKPEEPKPEEPKPTEPAPTKA